MRVTIKTGKGRLPIFIAIPTALLTGPLSLPIARALRKRAAQDEDLSDAEGVYARPGSTQKRESAAQSKASAHGNLCGKRGADRRAAVM